MDPEGLPVCAATGDQTSPRAVPAAGGASIIVWQDRRRGASLSDVYALSVAHNGSVTPGWPADGVALCESGLADPPIPVPDGAGGALVLWRDGRFSGRIYAQRVSASGAILGPTDGLMVSGGLVFTLLDAISDGAGGAFFVVRRKIDLTAPYYYAIVTGIDVNGTSKGWGRSFGRTIPDDDVPYGRLTADIDGGLQVSLFEAHEDFYDASYEWRVRRLSADGVVLATITLPHRTPGGSFSGIMHASTAPDGSGGFFASWHDRWGGYPLVNSIYMQHYAADGTPLWPVNWPAPTYQHVLADGEGGAYFIGSPYNFQHHLEVNRRQDGNPPTLPEEWTPDGVVLSDPASMGTTAVSTFGGDPFLCWSDNRGSGFDIRAVAIDPVGYVREGWEPDGTLISSATGDQTAPSTALMSPEQMLACWQDRRTGGWDIRASRIGIINTPTGVGPAPAMGAGLALGAPWPNPARDRISARLTAPGREPARLEVLDVTGRIVRSLDRSTTDGQDAALDVAGLPAGVYWLRLTQGTRGAARRFAVMR